MDKLILLLLVGFLYGDGDPVLNGIREDALKKGIPESFLEQVFSYKGITTHNKILERFAKPYEKKNWTEYRKLFVTESRIKKGASFFDDHKPDLISAEEQSGVNRYLILSIVGVESNYGRHKGQYNVFNALYTQISKMPRRANWAKKEMVAFLLYCYRDNVQPHSIKGSYAGAFGYGQFIPSSFNAYALDGNGDGIRMPYEWSDVFASIGNYLKKNGYPISNPDNEEQVYKSVFAYNRADNYVKAVLELKDELEKRIIMD